MVLMIPTFSTVSYQPQRCVLNCPSNSWTFYDIPTNGGTVDGYANGLPGTFHTCGVGSWVSIQATPVSGYVFSIWSTSAKLEYSPTRNSNAVWVPCPGSVSVTANFVMGLLVPLYMSPTAPDGNTHTTYWQDLINAKNTYSNVPVIAVVNPDNGPNSTTPAAIDPAYTSGMTNLTKAGILVLGYVYTCHGQRPLTGPNTASQCATRTDSSTGPEDDINTWYSLYGSLLSGTFLDQMDSQNCGPAPYSGSYYSTITTFAHNKGLNIVIGNPGCNTTSTYVGTVDTMTPYESSGLPTQSYVASLTTGQFSSTSPSQWGILAYNVAKSSLSQSYVSSLEGDTGWLYVTDATGNPYAVLPTYLQTEVSYLSNT